MVAIGHLWSTFNRFTAPNPSSSTTCRQFVRVWHQRGTALKRLTHGSEPLMAMSDSNTCRLTTWHP